jgi:two-component system NtrC family sensor kinase
MQFFKNYKITTKFILWFLFISLLPLTTAIYVSYTISRKALRQEIKNSLFVVADNKANQIETYLLKLKKDISALSYTPEFIDATEKFIMVLRNTGAGSTEYQAVQQEFKPMFLYYQKLFGYDDILLVNPEGEVVFSLGEGIKSKSLYEEALSKRSELSDAFIRAKNSQEIEISSFEYYPQNKIAAVFIALPVFKSSDLIGIAAFQVNNQGLYPFVQDYTGLGETGEAIIVSKIKDDAVFITPVRFDPQAAFKRKMKIGSGEWPEIQKALQGENGSGPSLDYRKKLVLTVWRYLPTFRLGMVVKMDSAEVFASANKLRNTLLKISFVILALVVFTAIIIARSISRPIKALTQTSKTISAGSLTARVKIEAEDEIGELAQSFNQMTDSLVEAKANVEQKKSEVEEQKSLLEAANKELDSFVYTVSHDLRAPLRGIDGLGVLLEQEYAGKFDEQGKDYLNKIRASANRMKMLIDDLLTLSRISRIKNPYEDVRIDELIKSITARLEFDIKRYNVEITVPGSLPIVRCDRIKIEEAFFNLISNAIKFSSKNTEINPKVQIGYNDKGDMHEFYVKDNGIGIDKKYHQEIFGIFKRLHKESEYEGTGAGLSIVKKIIDDHKGSIWVDSELGKGAAFYFTIPKKLKE